MTTEYYQIPSQQGFLPLAEESADPWLAAATSTLSIADWSVNKEKQNNPPSLFDSEDAESSVAWRNVIPLQYKSDIKAPASKQFISTSSKIDAWTVVDDTPKKAKKVVMQVSPKAQQPTTKVTKQPKVQQQQQQPQQEDGKPVEDELTVQNRYKTELCKSFGETGSCRYGTKCQFAHGKEEIRSVLRHPKYKTETCKTFHTTGTCPYGIRCRFIHTRSKEGETIVIVKQEEVDMDDDEESALSVPEWSKSWNMSMTTASPSKTAHHAVAAAPESAF